MQIAAKMDDMGPVAWIGLMVLSFIAFWPVGLAVLAFLIWSGRMGCSKFSRGDWRRRWDEMKQQRCHHHERRGRSMSGNPVSGNAAFDDYREETLRRLEAEQQEFYGFLDRLRQAKDKAEFDQFMAQRGRPAQAPETPPSV